MTATFRSKRSHRNGSGARLALTAVLAVYADLDLNPAITAGSTASTSRFTFGHPLSFVREFIGALGGTLMQLVMPASSAYFCGKRRHAAMWRSGGSPKPLERLGLRAGRRARTGRLGGGARLNYISGPSAPEQDSSSARRAGPACWCTRGPACEDDLRCERAEPT